MRELSATPRRFSLGRVLGTPAALKAIKVAGQDAAYFLARHAMGDWGEVCSDDARANADALARGERLLSAYRTLLAVRLYVITEADRSATTILLPEEY